MKLTLHFQRDDIGLIRIITNSETGSYDELSVNGENKTEDGAMCEKVASAIGHEAYLFAMYEAQYEGSGVYRQRKVVRAG